MTTTRRRDTARPVSEATGKAAPIVTGRTATGKQWHAKLAANAWRTARLGAEADV